MLTLGIETSCDETAVAVLDEAQGILSNIVSSQFQHSQYGGVVPEIASRAHLKAILPVLEKALSAAAVSLSQLDGIAVTRGPGLVGSLLVGISVAKALHFCSGAPLIGVHHIEAHIFAALLEDPQLSPPFVALVASGGHTQLIFLPRLGTYQILGNTRDDAAGEAFDKVAALLGLGYPGGPIVNRLAEKGNPEFVKFPRASVEGFDFSYSGLKTAVVNFVKNSSPDLVRKHLSDIAASFQEAAVEVLVEKSIRAAKCMGAEKLAVVGGVGANSRLRSLLKERAAEARISVYFPPAVLCTDNGAMVAKAGAFRLSRGQVSGLNLNANPRMKLESCSAGS
ncbi:MAG: tRNA (adenosine(37)-N6)-threonylcarbamoyltransferase complex transferase subunit TsaD [Candidatus Latescibacterota bacterium]|nr:MAG: tRNA (adenosine(37)-N6)-threonylcarbamoyltransferase complex transferase subunit TsaD [Candidatus Latescibacterota bacterium]